MKINMHKNEVFSAKYKILEVNSTITESIYTDWKWKEPCKFLWFNALYDHSLKNKYVTENKNIFLLDSLQGKNTSVNITYIILFDASNLDPILYLPVPIYNCIKYNKYIILFTSNWDIISLL